jgi:hypothetical protein
LVGDFHLIHILPRRLPDCDFLLFGHTPCALRRAAGFLPSFESRHDWKAQQRGSAQLGLARHQRRRRNRLERELALVVDQ